MYKFTLASCNLQVCTICINACMHLRAWCYFAHVHEKVLEEHMRSKMGLWIRRYTLFVM
jgi:hypothetical protein